MSVSWSGFARLKYWDDQAGDDASEPTSLLVIVPSMSFNETELAKVRRQ